MYSREDALGWRQSADFKKAFSIDLDIDMIGVWYVPVIFIDVMYFLTVC